MNNSSKNFISRLLIPIGFCLMVILAFGYVILGEQFYPSENQLVLDNLIELDSEWVQIGTDGSRTKVELPGVLERIENKPVILETTLPVGNLANMYLLTWTRGHKTDVYVNGEWRKSYDTSATRSFGRYHSYAYFYIPLSENDGGQTLQVVMNSGNVYYDEFYLGDQLSLTYFAVKNYAMELMLGIIMVFVGLVCFVIGFGFETVNKRKLRLKYLSAAVVISGMWVLTNSGARQFIFPNTSIVRDAAYMFVNLLPMPFLLFLNQVQKERYQKLYLTLEILVFVNFMVDLILFVTRTMEISKTNDFTLILIIVCALGCIYACVNDFLHKRMREYGWVAWGFAGFTIAALSQVVSFVIKSDSVYDGIIFVFGILWLLVCTIIDAIYNLIQMNLDKNAAIQASEAKGAFLANMSHEIRTPLNAVLGMDEMILRESADPVILEYASHIQSAGNTLLALINNILDFSKIESGKMEISEEKYSLSEMLIDQINLVANRAKAKKLEVFLEADPTMPNGLYGDDIRIRQIVTNIMTNAIKYTDKGSVTLKVKGYWKDELFHLCVSVKDTGIGIKPEDKAKLFESFERIDLAHNRSIEGTGLGLSITRQLLQLMGSTLEVDSVYGEGTEFSFDLVQKVEDMSPIGELSVDSKKDISDIKKYTQKFTAPEARVLVVDDNAMNLKVITHLLKNTKVLLDTASSGYECLEKIQQQNYDLIFMDHLMPQMDGIETMEKAKTLEGNLCKDAPIVVLTANAISGAKEMYLEKGFSDFLSKPIIPEKLEEMLINMLPSEKVNIEG